MPQLSLTCIRALGRVLLVTLAVLILGCHFVRRGGDEIPPFHPAKPPVPADKLKAVLDDELAFQIKSGLLSKRSGGCLVIGVVSHGERQALTYGMARPDSIFEIGSITKTFTGLILAQMVIQKEVTLREPIRELLPAGWVVPSNQSEITLLDLADQHSGLPRDPDNLGSTNPSNPYLHYGSAELRTFLAKRGLGKPANAPSQYSNIGFGILGYALSLRANVPFAQLVSDEITGPLSMHDTVINLSAEQRNRLVQGYDASFNPTIPWDFDVDAGAGALKSTASDMLTYLDANLHPRKYAADAAAGSPAATLPAAIELSHESFSDAPEIGAKVGLGWFINPNAPRWFDHNGGTGGYGSFARFCPEQDWGFVVLYNRDGPDPRFVDMVGVNITQLLTGQPSVRLDWLPETDRKALAAKMP